MTLLETVLSITKQTYYDEDGEAFRAELLPPMLPAELARFQQRLPGPIPREIADMLAVTKGITHPFLESVCPRINHDSWDDRLLPNAVYLAHDGRGNGFWVDVKSTGEWGAVLFVDHDPPIIMSFADSLQVFYELLYEDMREPGYESAFYQLYERVGGEIYQQDENVRPESNVSGLDIPAGTQLPQFYRVARIKASGEGFAWGLYASDDFLLKLPDQLVWIVEVVEQRDVLGRPVAGQYGRRKGWVERFFDFLFST